MIMYGAFTLMLTALAQVILWDVVIDVLQTYDSRFRLLWYM